MRTSSLLRAALWVCCAIPFGAAAGDREFAAAVAAHRQGDMSGAYARFMALANAGDADAARIALFMHRYGTPLYRSAWDALRPDVDGWTRAAAMAGRPVPVFRPLPSRKPKRKGSAADGAMPLPEELAFADAPARYHGQRYPDAYGRFIEMADGGDADAARIVLFMHRYGALLYGSHWDLDSDQLASYQQMAGTRIAPVAVAHKELRRTSRGKALPR